MPLMSMLVEVAADIRRRSGLTEPAFSTKQIVDACFPATFVTGANLPDGFDEVVKREREGALIVYKRSLPGPAQRFAIAHALAHLLFDSALTCARPGLAGNPESERRADLFATELLAPLEEVARFASRFPSEDPDEHELYLDQVDEIASRFVVPADVIDSQIRRLIPANGNE